MENLVNYTVKSTFLFLIGKSYICSKAIVGGERPLIGDNVSMMLTLLNSRRGMRF
jgi:hypothetical protein